MNLKDHIQIIHENLIAKITQDGFAIKPLIENIFSNIQPSVSGDIFPNDQSSNDFFQTTLLDRNDLSLDPINIMRHHRFSDNFGLQSSYKVPQGTKFQTLGVISLPSDIPSNLNDHVLYLYQNGNSESAWVNTEKNDFFVRLITNSTVYKNTSPKAVSDNFTLNEDTSALLNVLANDSDADSDTLTVISFTSPLNGSLTFNADNSFTYTPNIDFFGSDSFSYTISDGKGGTDTTSVNLTINDVIETPAYTPTILGTSGDEVLDGTPGDDVIDALAGSDTIRAGAGDDIIFAGAGSDNLRGQEGADRFIFDEDAFGFLDDLKDFTPQKMMS